MTVVIGGNRGRKRLRRTGVAIAVVVSAGIAGGFLGAAAAGPRSSLGDGQFRGPGVASAASKVSPRTSATVVGTEQAGSNAIACPMIPSGSDSTGENEGVGTATHLFTRTTADGVTIRAYGLPSTGSCGCGPIPEASSTSPSGSPGSVVAGAPVPPGVPVSVELSDDAAVGDGVLFDDLSPTATTTNAGAGSVATVSSAFGVSEGAPVWWVAASVGPDVVSAEMRFADGSTDQMTPIDGVAVLAHPIDPSVASSGEGPYEVRGTLQLLDATGSVLRTLTFPGTTATPVPLPEPVPVSPPAVTPDTAPSGPAPTLVTPSVSNGSMSACPGLIAPTQPLKAITPPPANTTGNP